MKLTFWLAVVVLVLAAFGWSADEEGKARKDAWSAEAGFVAHEWGAIIIDSRHPYGPGEMADDLRGTPAWRGEQVAGGMAAGKGKPVLFLYAADEMQIDVTVKSTDGDLLFSWPTPVAERRETHSDDPWAAVGSDIFQWKNVKLLPVGEASKTKQAVITDAKHWWNDCREAGASQLVSGGESYPQVEQFLFYDGTSNWRPEVAFSLDEDEVVVLNNCQQDLRDVFVVHRGKMTDPAQWGYVDCVQVGRKQKVKLQSVASFEERFITVSVAAGLYRKEAAACWVAWERQFYTNDGLRVVYRLSAAEMDTLMPLTITPKPAEQVRVNWVCLGK